jgi:hypothetical protein
MPPFTAAIVAAEAIAAAEALAIAEAAAAAAAAAETAAATAAAAEAATAGITAAEAATAAETAAAAAETGAQGIMQAVPEATNVAAEGSNVAAQKAQEEAVNQGLNRGITQAANPMAETMQKLYAEEALKTASTNPGTQLAGTTTNAPGFNPGYASDAYPNQFIPQGSSGAPSTQLSSFTQPTSPTTSFSSSSPTIDPLDPFGGFPSSGPTPPPASTESAANVINQGMQQPPNPFMQAYEYVDKMHPLSKGLGAYGLLSASGALRQEGASPPGQKTFNNPYHFSPNFKGTHPNPNDYQYTPRYPSYASGGITSLAMGGPAPQTNFANPSQSMMGTSQYDMPTDPMSGNIANRMASGGVTDVPGYKRGGDMDIYDASLRFANMLDNPSRYTPPDTRFQSVDTFRDTNPNTATKLADEAAETRRKAIEQRSYVNTGAKFPTVSRRPGQLDLGPVGGERGKYDNQESILAAQGGIMGYNLGGYANGGNPRLLRGPGDGMSDNIPATIANRQPARLADGEFVVPADVVSHLGNGSTEAGAKKLHEMMNSVRKARTGNPKQGKKINPSKFMPKK